MDRFLSEVKPKVRAEVMKAGQVHFKTATQIALNVKSSIIGATRFTRFINWGSPIDGIPQFKDLDNVEDIC